MATTTGLAVGITPAQLQTMRIAAQAVMITPCAILRKSITPDGAGGWLAQWDVVSDYILTCSVKEYKEVGTETVSGGRLESRTRWLINLPANTDVMVTDRIVAWVEAIWPPPFIVDSHGYADNGVTYEVSKVVGPVTYEAERNVYCWLLQ